MDKQLDKAIMQFYSDIRGKGTDELYSEYIDQCMNDRVEPRSKSVIIREACEMTGCVIEKRQRLIVDKFFVPKDERYREEWRQVFKNNRGNRE